LRLRPGRICFLATGAVPLRTLPDIRHQATLPTAAATGATPAATHTMRRLAASAASSGATAVVVSSVGKL
jgi:hypothetical protein